MAAWFSKKEKGQNLGIFAVLSLIILSGDARAGYGYGGDYFGGRNYLVFSVGSKNLVFFYSSADCRVVGFLFAKLEPYRAARLSAYLNFNQNIGDSSYHVKQILIALGSGGLTGVGLG